MGQRASSEKASRAGSKLTRSLPPAPRGSCASSAYASPSVGFGGVEAYQSLHAARNRSESLTVTLS